MADQKLTVKTEATTVADTDIIHVVVGGVSRKVQKINFLKELQAELGAQSFVELSDVDETTLEGNEGKVADKEPSSACPTWLDTRSTSTRRGGRPDWRWPRSVGRSDWHDSTTT